MHLFRALSHASVYVGQYLESELSDILRHTPPRLPDGRLKRGKCKKSAVGGKKSPASPVQKRDYLINHISLVIQPTIINPLLPK